MKTKMLQHRFVENIPDKVEEGILYISIPYCIAIHKCVCGCGNEVSTPISPTGWDITFHGENVSLSPSIGNWSYPCQSHYFIVKGKVQHALKWSSENIEECRKADANDIATYYSKKRKKRK